MTYLIDNLMDHICCVVPMNVAQNREWRNLKWGKNIPDTIINLKWLYDHL